AVHACWDDRAISEIKHGLEAHQGVTASFLQLACRKGKQFFDPVETILKGKEAKLPDGFRFLDKDGHDRTWTRVRWYQSPVGLTYRTYALNDGISCDAAIEQSVIDRAIPYPSDAKPVFIGHYWLSEHQPELLAHNVACLDYSVARGGFLCAYRWNG